MEYSPVRSKTLSALPGIGRYTAAAVLSIAFDAPLAVLDGNVAAYSPVSAQFAAICASQKPGGFSARRAQPSSRSKPPAIGIRL